MSELKIEPDELHRTLCDALSGWRYIREAHGDLYGVGWDRVENRLNTQITQSAIRLKAGEKQLQEYQEWVDSLEKRIAELEALIDVAICPNCDKSGAYYDGYGEVCQCQWCYEVAQAVTPKSQQPAKEQGE